MWTGDGAEMKVFRFSLGATKMDRIKNGSIRGTAHVEKLGEKVRKTRLTRFGHVQRMDSCGYFG